MNRSLIFLSLALAVTATRPTQPKTTLEDIDRDYTTVLKRNKLSPPPLPNLPAKSPTQFGFVPAKTASDYVQQDARQNYAAKYQVGGARQVQTYQTSPQYQTTGVQYLQESVTPYNAGASQYQVGVSPYQVGVATQEYAGAGGHQQYNTIQYSAPTYTGPTYTGPVKTEAAPQVYYVPQAQGQYENYENLQYVTDNSVGQAGQQYVYLQQYQAPSTAVQSVAEPAQGGVQYVMYLPSYNPSTPVNKHQSYESVINYTPSSADLASYLAPSSQKSQYYQAQYSQKEEPISQGKTQYTKANYITKREPKSLLDSYVPSNVQLQYYRAQQNAIQGGTGKTGSRYSYIPSYSS